MQIQVPIDADLSGSSVTSVRNLGKRLMNRELGSTGIIVVEVKPRCTDSDVNGIKLR